VQRSIGVFAGLLILVVILNVGYYNYVEEYGPDSTTFFGKVTHAPSEIR
jgi:hypothetical protein